MMGGHGKSSLTGTHEEGLRNMGIWTDGGDVFWGVGIRVRKGCVLEGGFVRLFCDGRRDL